MNFLDALKKITAGKRTVIFGTGQASKKITNMFNDFEYYVDNDLSIQGESISGKQVFSPKQLLKEEKDQLVVLIASSYYREISIQLDSYGFEVHKHYFNGLLPQQSYFSQQMQKGLEVDGCFFTNFITNGLGSHSVGFCLKQILKIEHFRVPDKKNSLAEEAKMIGELNDRNCVTVPKLISSGRLSTGQEYFVQERIFSKGRPSTADILFSLIEQKNLGYYHGDLNPGNILFDGQVCYFVDYDQAEYNTTFKDMGNREFIEFMSSHSIQRYNVDLLERYDEIFDKRGMLQLLDGDSFLMGKSTLFRMQSTTLELGGIYHNLQNEKIKIRGVRDFSNRIPLLDQINFIENEGVLDVGCNMGLLSHYLNDRGCKVTGIDLDASIISIARMVANILGKKVEFHNSDLDTIVFDKKYDTICFFSVLQHVENLKIVGEKVSQSCNRIIIENGLYESGEKPQLGHWDKTTSWYFENIEELSDYFEEVFVGFKLSACYGKADRERFILEFKKDTEGAGRK